MTLRRSIAALLLSLANANGGEGSPPPAPTTLPHEVHDGYFVSNRFEPDAARSFVIATDQASFDAVFGVARVMGDKSRRLPAGVFDSKLVAAAIHRGKSFVTYQVESVTREGDALVIRYATKSQPSDSAAFACPLILSIAKGDFRKLRFLENGKEIKQLEHQAPSAPLAVECRKPGSLQASTADGKALLSIHEAGIGSGKVTCPTGSWPQQVLLKVHLKGLESLTLGGERAKLKLSVLSHSGHQTLLHLVEDGKEGPQLEQDSPYWTEVRRLGPDGKAVAGLPPRGGCFELRIPRALLDATRTLSLEWIDFFRG